MFLIMGVNQGQKQLEFRQPDVCPNCGKYGSYEAFMTYYYFSLFFIPLFRWNKRYYVKTTCCNTVYSIDKELGNALEKGRKKSVCKEDIHEPFSGAGFRQCSNCGYKTGEDRYLFCPICGHKL